MESIVCDVCKTKFESDNIFQIQEFHHIRFTGGYGSVFGDGTRVECDICQECLKKLIEKYIRTEKVW